VPWAVHHVLPGTGHACCIEDPAGFDRLVIDFLQLHKLMPKL
jgi:pimeloyl-ACP methyl ester carboxylesterase